MTTLSPRLFAFALAGLVALIVGAAGTIWTRRRRARRGRECLLGAMRSVSEAVIVTDARGTVTAMNERAEWMTGWRQSEAVGQPIASVFRLVDARTYHPVVHPVVRALYKKIVVGPSHETLLVGKDGVERQVREMAAPIFDDAGRVFAGAVAFKRVNSTRLSTS